jgi:archaellum component FlaC
MSEDKTEISGNEEPTEGLETSKAPTTNMMIETLLLEVRAGFAKVNSRLDAIDNRLNVSEKRFNAVSIESMDMKARIIDHENRIDELERKAS